MLQNKTDGKKLMLENVPLEFRRRYGSLPREMYIRECYEDLYEEATLYMLDPMKSTPSILFTGVPGIGKSIFLIYFLWRYSQDGRFEGKSFAFEVEHGGYYYFQQLKENGEFFCSGKLLDINQIPLDDILLVADLKEHREPSTPGKWTLIFSSPDPVRYKDTMKMANNITYTVPTWNYEELRMVEPDVSKWLSSYNVCGGVARLLFSAGDPIAKINAALKFRGASVIEYFFKYGFGGLDSDTNYALIHINPPYSVDEGRYLYDAPIPDYAFASDYVIQQLTNMYVTKLFGEQINLFNAGGGLVSEKLGGATAGNLFEKICLWILPMAGEEIAEGECISLIDDQRPLGAFKFPLALVSLPRNFKKTGDLMMDVFYRPLSATLESGDSFCVLELNGTITLIIIQYTVAKDHGVRVKGLQEIFEAFNETVRASIKRKIVLFVTPFDGNLCSKQPFLIAEGRTYGPTTDFEQWTYRRTLKVKQN